MATQQSQSYAKAAKAESYPTKEQAIIVEAIEGTQLKEYITAIAEKVTPQQIKFASKISNNRICVYLANKTIAEDLVEVHKSITVQNKTLHIRPLITKNKRIIISNVPPHIPNSTITSYLRSRNIEIASQISFLRAGLNDSQFSHIMSFRRQAYIHPDDVNKLPDSLQLEFEETQYRVYIATETLGCYHCKAEGHIAKNCTTLHNNTADIASTETPENLTSSQLDDSADGNIPMDETSSTSNISSTNTKKRQLSLPGSPTLSPIEENKSQNSTSAKEAIFRSPNPTKKPKKNLKAKLTLIEDKVETLMSVQEEIEKNPTKYPLTFTQLKNFLEKARGQQRLTSIVTEFETSNAALSEMLKNLYKFLPERSFKSKFTKLAKKLQREEKWPEDEMLSDGESSTSEQFSQASSVELNDRD